MRIPSALNAKSQFAGKINFVSAIILGLAIGLIMFWLTLLDARYALLGAVGIVAFVVAEARSKNPLLSRELLRNRGFVFSAVALAIMMVSFFGIVFLMSFYFQSVAGFSPLIAGVWVAPLPAALGIVNPISGKLFDRFSRPALMAILGAFIVIGSVFLLSAALKNTSPGLTIALLLAVIGIGGGLVWSPTIAGALAFSKPEMRGVANGTAFTMIYVGFATSVSVVVSVSTASLPAALSAAIQSGALTGLSGASAVSFDQGLINALLVLALIGIVGVPFLFMVLREQVRQRRSGLTASSEGAVPTAAT